MTPAVLRRWKAWRGLRQFATTTNRRLADTHRITFSAIQPTGVPHVRASTRQYQALLLLTFLKLGNFLGALRNWVELQRDAKPEDALIFAIAGWHALTLPQDPRALSASRRDMLAVLLSIGLNPRRTTIFHQDEVWPFLR